MFLYSTSGRWRIILHQCSGRAAYAPIFSLRAVTLVLYILPPNVKPIILDHISGRVAYTPIFDLRAVSLCFYILPPGA